MGTETYSQPLQQPIQILNTVKLNNPLMGTETFLIQVYLNKHGPQIS